MCVPNSHVVFSPKNNFQELQHHQILIFFYEFWQMCQDHIKSILDKSVSAILKKILGFNFICVLAFFFFFQKYAMTSADKSPKIYVNIHYLANRGRIFLRY